MKRVHRKTRACYTSGVVAVNSSRVAAWLLRKEKLLDLATLLSSGNAKGALDLVETIGQPIVPTSKEPLIGTPLMAEVLIGLDEVGIPFPKSTPTNPGELAILTREQAQTLRRRIDEFLPTATDQVLYPLGCLFFSMPAVMRAGIEYLRDACDIPDGYEAVALFAI